MHDGKEEQRRQVDPGGLCAHSKVVYRASMVGEDRYEDHWYCDLCEKEFWPMPNFDFPGGKLQVMEPYATLRDQFAMAAMVADSIQSALIAVSYIAQGKSFSGDFADLGTDAEEYYKTADALMEARKK